LAPQHYQAYLNAQRDQGMAQYAQHPGMAVMAPVRRFMITSQDILNNNHGFVFMSISQDSGNDNYILGFMSISLLPRIPSTLMAQYAQHPGVAVIAPA
jgi:hypothetical protein